MGQTYKEKSVKGLTQAACSNLDANLVVNTKAAAFTIRETIHNIEIFLDVDTAPTGSTIIVDITVGGTTIFSAKPVIAISAFASSGTYVLTTTTLTDGDRIVIKIDQIGSTIAGKNLITTIKGSVL